TPVENLLEALRGTGTKSRRIESSSILFQSFRKRLRGFSAEFSFCFLVDNLIRWWNTANTPPWNWFGPLAHESPPAVPRRNLESRGHEFAFQARSGVLPESFSRRLRRAGERHRHALSFRRA